MSKREQEKTTEAAQRDVDEAKNAAQSQIGQQVAVAQEFQSTISRLLDETKENVRKSVDEARNQIPQYTDTVKNYQEQALESTGKVVEGFIEVQKSVIDSVSSSAAMYYENANRIFSYWYSPGVSRAFAEIWARAVSTIAENVSAATRINNDILFTNIEAFGNEFKRAQQYTEELSRINVDIEKTIANTTRETAAEFSANRQREVYR